jgi:hypothetical protein
MPFSGVFGTKGSIGTGCAALLPDINRRPNLCHQERDLRAFAKKVGYKIVGVWNEIPPGQSRSAPNARRSWHLAQARTVALILVTELTRWGRSARFAARPLACFKFRFVSSPQIVDSIRLDPEMLWQTA